jgi:nucleoside phosphorylase
MPTSDLIQTSIAHTFAAEFQLLARSDLLYFVGSTIDPAVLQASKKAHFGGTRLHPEWDQASTGVRLMGFQEYMHTRATDTTNDVRVHWYADVASLGGAYDGSHYAVRQLMQARDLMDAKPPPTKFESALEKVPERLGSHAFLWNVIQELKIFPFDAPPTAGHHFEMALGWNWARSYLAEYGTMMIGRIPGVGFVDCGLRSTNPDLVIDLVTYDSAMNMLGLGEAFRALTTADIVRLRMDLRIIYLREGILTDVYDFLSHPDPRGPSIKELPALARQIGRIQDSAKSAHSALEAITRAAAAAVDSSGTPSSRQEQARSGETPNRTVRDLPASTSGISIDSLASDQASGNPRRSIVVLVALVEELGATLSLIQDMLGTVEVIDEIETGRILYAANYGNNRMLFALAGKGQERSAATAAVILGKHRPVVAANIGIAGALSDDLKIGDVVIGDQIVNYLANAKAIPDDTNDFSFRMAGEALRSDDLLVERAAQLALIRPEAFKASRERVARGVDPSLAPLMSQGGFEILSGPIACGPVVSAAQGFRTWLRNWKRDFIAVDMETSGIAVAASLSGAMGHIRYIAIRGISDLADENKHEIEAVTRNASRRVAMRSSLEVLLLMIDSLPEALL